jgi:Glycoside hydrolase 123, catalytic domain
MKLKKIIPFVTVMGLPLVLCLGSSKEINNPEVRLTVLNSMERISQDQPLFGMDQAVVKAAKNEVESFQIVVGAIGKNVRVTSAVISDLRGNAGTIGKENVMLYREEYTRVRQSSPRAQLPPGLYPDPLVPFINPETGKPVEPFNQYRKKWGEPFISSGYEMYALPFDVWKGENQPIWADIYIPENTAAGEYKGTFTVTLGNVPEQYGPDTDSVTVKTATIPVSVTVWDFKLPDGPTQRNHFGTVSRIIPGLYGTERNSARSLEIELRYCRMMADNRINPPIPAGFMPEVNPDGSLNIIPERHQKLKKFLEELHVTDFQIPNAPFKEITTTNRAKAIRYYREFYKYLTDNGWNKRAYLYMLDEPNLKENYEEVLALGAVAHEAAPEIRCLVVEQTYPQDPSWPDIDPAVDIWCPLWAFIDSSSIISKIKHGDEVWSYTALSQRAPKYSPDYNKVKDFDSPYWHIDARLTSYRVPSWINWHYNITGLLYWSSVQITKTVSGVMDPWFMPAFSESDSQFNGGGYLMYPGVPCGINGPLPCIRLKTIRDSMEDWEYFAILEQLAGRDAVNKIVSDIAPNWWASSEDPAAIGAAREKIAAEIVRLKKNTK